MSELKALRIPTRSGNSLHCYIKSEADKVIEKLKADYQEACDRLHTANLIKDEQKAKADNLLSCLKSLVIRDLIKNCSEKDSAIEIVKEYVPETSAPRRATNRELANWLAMGNGEIFLEGTNFAVSTQHIYSRGIEDEPCGEDYVVRKWDDTKWHKPTLDYMEIGEGK